jgi:hypothetical protein
MSFTAFIKLCPVAGADDVHLTENTQGRTVTVTITSAGNRPNACIGKFVFVNDKLESMSR